ncbi:hypothetical protein THOM_3208 [Trachipleistophora hominis]|uniref:Uncharacterized protein n=1 Tax=Trachipleistophora hominis TaxID=72359 RepID=L7JS69_TRAHO|nr:hypothetical protein THOM_3208 [Trachipleistophora hominis]
MKFYLRSTVRDFDKFCSQNPTFCPIYRQTFTTNDETRIVLSKTEGSEIYALCDTEDFDIKDLFEYKFLQDDDNNIVDEGRQTKVKKAKQSSLFNFMKSN